MYTKKVEYDEIDMLSEFVKEWQSQKSWSNSCECKEDDKHGATWCCNHCGLPTIGFK